MKLSDGELVSFVEIAKVKLLESSIYPKSQVNELKSYTVCFSETDLSTLKDIYGYLIKSGDAEKFYSRFYSTIAFNVEKIFHGISRTAAILLSTKMADCMLEHTKRKTKPQLSTPMFERNMKYS